MLEKLLKETTNEFWEKYSSNQQVFLEIAEGKRDLDSWNDEMRNQGDKLESFLTHAITTAEQVGYERGEGGGA